MRSKQSYSKVSFIAYAGQYKFTLSSQRNYFVGINEDCQIKGNNLEYILSILYENNNNLSLFTLHFLLTYL